MLLNLKYRKDLEGMVEMLTKMREWKKDGNNNRNTILNDWKKNDIKFSVSKINAHGKKLNYRYTTVDSKSSVIVQGRNLGLIVDISLKN